jgi:hypothetical protein
LPTAPICRQPHLEILKTGYNRFMSVAIFAMRVAEVLFFAGLLGSAVVVLVSFVEDAKELLAKDEES